MFTFNVLFSFCVINAPWDRTVFWALDYIYELHFSISWWPKVLPLALIIMRKIVFFLSKWFDQFKTFEQLLQQEIEAMEEFSRF